MNYDGRSVVERAFELAKSGTCKSIDDIRRQLKLDGHSNVDAHLAGLSIRKQLHKLMAEAADRGLSA